MTDFSEKIVYIREVVNNKINEAVGKQEPISLYTPIQYFIGNSGKRLRPILLILAAEAVGAPLDAALNAAVAVELLHNFTLVHDDIMDHDKMRRGRPTVHSKWDEETAILAGDSLVALAYRMLLSTDSPNIGRIARVFTEGIIEVCEGQALDKEFENRDNVTLDDYYNMIDKKTARLFVTSCELGAIIGGGNEEEISALGEYGAWLGRAFQIQDDLLDILSSEEISGKTFGSDIKQGKKTFLVIRALQSSDESQCKKLMAVLGKRDTQSSDIEKIIEIFEEIGIINEARDIVKNYLKSLFTCLDHIRNSHAKQLLKEIPQQLVSRQS